MKILVVDDDAVSRLMVQSAVEQLGHECVLTEDGAQAWEILEGSHADVVVTDWLMPGMDGLELCRRIREQVDGRYTYVIVVTSRADHDHIRTGMAAGADDYLTKPLVPFELETRLIAAARVTSLHAQLEDYRRELRRLACTDPLTRLRNRLSLGDDLDALHAQSERYGHGYSLAMCDIDGFKSYNDTHGHQAGDEVLRAVAETLDSHVRAADIVYRFGGEEFLIVLPDQSLEAACVAAERARVAVEDLALPHLGAAAGVVTISAGVAAFGPADSSPQQVLRRADEALYEAKEKGRNRVQPDVGAGGSGHGSNADARQPDNGASRG